MLYGFEHFEKRLQRLEQLVLQIAEKLEILPDEVNAVGPTAPYTQEIHSDFCKLRERVSSLQVDHVTLRLSTDRYMNRRVAQDNHIHRKVDAVDESLSSLEERISHVELAAFPTVGATISKAIGEHAKHDPKSDQLDRTPFNPHRKK